MVQRRNFRIAQFSMVHACALVVLLALGVAIDPKDGQRVEAGLANAAPEIAQPVIIKATFWKVFQCDEAKDVDV